MLARHLGIALLAYLSFVLQLSTDVPGRAASTTPDYLLGALTVAVLAVDHWSVIVWGGMIGLLGDVLSPDPLGVGMLLAAMIALTAQMSGLAAQRRPLVSVAVWSFLIASTTALAVHTVRLVLGGMPVDPVTAVRLAAEGGLVSCVYAVIVLAAGRAAARVPLAVTSGKPSKSSPGWRAIE